MELVYDEAYQNPMAGHLGNDKSLNCLIGQAFLAICTDGMLQMSITMADNLPAIQKYHYTHYP